MIIMTIVRVGCYFDESLSNAHFCNPDHRPRKALIPKPGTEIEIIQTIARILKWDLEFVPFSGQPDYGTPKADGNWSGLVGELMNDRIDVAGMLMTILSQRQKVIDYSMPVSYMNQIMFVGKEMLKADDKMVSFVLKPFQYDMWTCLLASLVLVAVINWLYVYIIRPERREHVVASVWELFSIAMRQDYRHYGIKARAMLAIQWVFFCLLVTTYYQSVQNSMLAVELGKKIPFTSLDGLINITLNKPELGWKIVDFTPTPNFQCPSKAVCERLKQVKVTAFGTSYESWRAIQHAIKWDYGVFFGNIEQVMLPNQVSGFRTNSIRSTISPLVVIRDDTIQQARLAFAFQKNSTLQNDFNRALIEVQPGIERIIQKYKIAHPAFGTGPRPTDKPLTMWRMQEAFWLYCIGVGLAIFCAAFEIVPSCYKAVTRRRKGE